MQQNLNNLLNTDGPVYNAAYNAMLVIIPEPYNDTEIEADDTGDMTALLETSILEQKKKRIDDAKMFAQEFVDGLKSGGFMNAIVDEVDKHIKSAQIDINIPALLPTIVSPMGPCTGSLSISGATGAQITIS